MALYSISWAHGIAGFSDPCKSSLVKQVREGVIRKISKSPVSKERLYKRLFMHMGLEQNY